MNDQPHKSTPLSAQPLDMTVHALPQPQDMLASDASYTPNTPKPFWSGRLKMLLVLAVCAAPVVASYFTYYVVRPEGRRNFGTLINPQKPLPSLQARNAQGQAIDLQTLKGQWLLVALGGGACAPSSVCQDQLYLQRQLRESLGKDKDRLDRVWLVTDDQPIPAELGPGLQGATVLRADAQALANWLEPEAGQPLESHLYVVDPMGNWMLRYPPRLDIRAAAQAKRDLERLMRASASWDKPGR